MNAPTSSTDINADAWSSRLSPRGGSLGVIIRTFKAAVTTLTRMSDLNFGWQRNYYEHIIRTERELDAIRAYIANNPAKWALDRENQED